MDAPSFTIDKAKRYSAELVTSLGTIVVALDPLAAPMTVNNFVYLARSGFYDGLTFHRVLRNALCQAGDPTSDGTGGPGYTFADELPKPYRYQVGSVAMANAGPNTNGSQFFIIAGPKGVGLAPKYSLFGQVVKGLDVVEAIQRVPTDSEVPTTDIIIERILITERD